MGDSQTPATGQREPTHPLGVRSFRYLWLNTISFYLVANALRFVYGWVILDGLRRGEWWQGFAIFALGAPNFFLLIPSGVWADRVDPKRFLIATQAALLVVMAGTAIALGSGAESLGLVLVSAVLAGSASVMGQPVRISLVPSLLPPHLLYAGIALDAIAITLSLALGALSVKVMGEWFGFDGAFWWMALLIALGMIAIWFIETPGAPAPADATLGIRESIAVGVRFIRSKPGIAPLFVLVAVTGLFTTPLTFVTLQAHLKAELGRTAGDAAEVFALIALGIALASVGIIKAGAIDNKSRLLIRSMLLGYLVLGAIGVTTAYWQVLVLAFFMGLLGGVYLSVNQGLVQANTPPDVMGRVMALYTLVQSGLVPIGAVLLGYVATQIGTSSTLIVGSASAFMMVLAMQLTSQTIFEID